MAWTRTTVDLLRFLRDVPKSAPPPTRPEISAGLDHWAPVASVYFHLRELVGEDLVKTGSRLAAKPGRPSKTYQITTKGRRALAKYKEEDETRKL